VFLTLRGMSLVGDALNRFQPATLSPGDNRLD